MLLHVIPKYHLMLLINNIAKETFTRIRILKFYLMNLVKCTVCMLASHQLPPKNVFL